MNTIQEVEARAIALLERAQLMTIETAEDAQRVNAFLNEEVIPYLKSADEFCDPNIKRWHNGWKEALADKARATLSAEEAKKFSKQLLVAWTKREEARIADEEKKQREAAVKAEEEKRLKQAEQLTRQGKPEAADAVLSKPITVAPPVIQKTKLAGFSTRKVWKGRILDPKALVAHIAANPQFLNLIEIKQGELNRIANSFAGALQLPGVEMYQDDVATARTA